MPPSSRPAAVSFDLSGAARRKSAQSRAGPMNVSRHSSGFGRKIFVVVESRTRPFFSSSAPSPKSRDVLPPPPVMAARLGLHIWKGIEKVRTIFHLADFCRRALILARSGVLRLYFPDARREYAGLPKQAALARRDEAPPVFCQSGVRLMLCKKSPLPGAPLRAPRRQPLLRSIARSGSRAHLPGRRGCRPRRICSALRR